MWILINKSSGRLKQLPWTLDYLMAEATLKRAEEINKHVASGTMPDFAITWDAEICEECSFFALCNPPVDRVPAQLIIDEHLIGDVNEMLRLAPEASKFETLKEGLKKKLETVEHAYLGDYEYKSKKRSFLDRFVKLEKPK